MPDLREAIVSAERAAEIVAHVAATAATEAPDALAAALETIDAPVYLTDKNGLVTFFNSACIDFAGRTPIAGQDRWCVTWRLYTEDGVELPHASCPMAVAIGEKRCVRGAVAIAERPDGTRVLFTPFPTPIVDATGALTGAVNMLIDITDRRQAEALSEQAKRCRRLALTVSDPSTVRILTDMAAEYDARARALIPAASLAD